MELAIPLISPAVQIIEDNLKINSVTGGSTTSWKREFTANQHQQHSRKETQKPPVTFGALSWKQHSKNNFKNRIEIVKKSVYQYIKNHINNYLFGNYNISEVRSNLYNNLVYYSQLGTENLDSETLVTYFHKLNFNIIKYCEKTYPVQSQYSIDFELETKTSNKGKNKLKQYSKTTSNTSTLQKTTAKHLQTPEQETSSKLSLTITPFPASLAQAQTPNSPLNRFARPENFTSLRTENQSEHSETTANKENNSEISEEELINSKNEEDEITTYIAKIPEFNRENIETSPQEWLDQQLSYQGQHAWVLATCGIFNKHSEKAPAFEFKPAEEKPTIKTFMALGSTSNWANETEQKYFSTNNSLEIEEPMTPGWNVSYSKPEPWKQHPYIPLKCKDCHKKLSSIGVCISPEEEYKTNTYLN
ncbi:hypothetical protein G9A89_021391 [Geosiphon pyriformis]|nr:hypothetical protein G9A89_021391 [Geosiphon pyriformis]